MRILYLSQLIPYPPNAGPKARIYHVLQYLKMAGHQVTLVAFRRDEDREEDIEHLHKYCANVHTVFMRRSRVRDIWDLARSTIKGKSFLISRDSVSEMFQLLRNLVSQQHFDIIHADQLWMAQYGLVARNAYRNGMRPLTVLDQHNAVFLIPKRLAAGTSNRLKQTFFAREARSLAHYELETCQQYDLVVWVTEEDRAAIARLANGQRSFQDDLIIPICVDPQNTRPILRQSQPRRITFLGGMHWPPNTEGISWFAREVWPEVHQNVPDAILTVIGKNPPTTLYEDHNQNVEVTGYVAELEPYLAETAVFIVPIHAGGGMRVKILDAWCWGLPVVSTQIGAEGLKHVDGENLLLADNPGKFAKAVITLLSKPELAADLSAGGRSTVETYYDWHKVYRAWDKVYAAAR